MKTITLTLTCVLFLGVSLRPVYSTPVFSSAQQVNAANPGDPNSFIMFVAHRQANAAALVWSISMPGRVNGFEIERSYDGEFFEVIGNEACNNKAMHRFRDNNVFPGYVHYRIKAYLKNGNVEYSDISMVRIIKRR